MTDDDFRRRYQSLVGTLLYCSVNTRPDVALAVGYPCLAMSKPTDDLFSDAFRVLYYLERTKDLGLAFEGDDLALHGMNDLDWAVKHFTSGFVFMLNKAAISWGSTKQISVALSSCEAKLMAGSEAAKEAVYFRRYQEELGYTDPSRPSWRWTTRLASPSPTTPSPSSTRRRSTSRVVTSSSASSSSSSASRSPSSRR